MQDKYYHDIVILCQLNISFRRGEDKNEGNNNIKKFFFKQNGGA